MELNRRIVVLGGGESGTGAAILAQKKGFDVWLSDMGSIAPKYKELLDSYGVAWEEGGHTESKVLAADEVVKSPGIPDTAPIIQKLNRSVREIVNDSFHEKVFKTVIRDNVALAEAPINGKTIFEYNPKSNGANDYMSLAKEVINLK